MTKFSSYFINITFNLIIVFFFDIKQQHDAVQQAPVALALATREPCDWRRE
jgi:hypothetical protein